MKRFAIDPDSLFAKVSDENKPDFTDLSPTVEAIARLRSEKMDEACASVLMYGWTREDCRIEHNTATRRDVLIVGRIPVFEITERWLDTRCLVEWRWLAEIPEREGFEVPKA